MGQVKQPRKCACGCGEMTKGGTYRPGHDSKHTSALLRSGKHKEIRKRGLRKDEPPEWVTALVALVCEENFRAAPWVRWTTTDDIYASGVCDKSRGFVGIKAGTDRVVNEVYLLHELTHWICPPKAAHKKLFWTKAWSIYQRYCSDLFVACRDEFAYRKKAWEYCPPKLRAWYVQEAEDIRLSGNTDRLVAPTSSVDGEAE